MNALYQERGGPARPSPRMSDLRALIESLEAEQHRLISAVEGRGDGPDGQELDRIASLARRILAVEALIEDR